MLRLTTSLAQAPECWASVLCLVCPGAAIKCNWLVLGTEEIITMGHGSVSESNMVAGQNILPKPMNPIYIRNTSQTKWG